MRNYFHNGVAVRIHSNTQCDLKANRDIRSRFWPDSVEDLVKASTLMARDVAGGQRVQQG